MFNCLPSALSWNRPLNKRPQINAIRAIKAVPIRGENPLCIGLGFVGGEGLATTRRRENAGRAGILQTSQDIPDFFGVSRGVYEIEPGCDASIRGNDERVAAGEPDDSESEQAVIGACGTPAGVGLHRIRQAVFAGKVGMRSRAVVAVAVYGRSVFR